MSTEQRKNEIYRFLDLYVIYSYITYVYLYVKKVMFCYGIFNMNRYICGKKLTSFSISTTAFFKKLPYQILSLSLKHVLIS